MFLVCILRDFRFGTSLAEVTRIASPRGRQVRVRWIHKDQDLRGCHIVFVSSAESKRQGKDLQAVPGADVVTVGEQPDSFTVWGPEFFVSKRRPTVRGESPRCER